MVLEEANLLGAYSSLRKLLESLAKICAAYSVSFELYEQGKSASASRDNSSNSLNETRRILLKVLATNLVLELDLIFRGAEPCDMKKWKRFVEELVWDVRRTFIDGLYRDSSLFPEEKYRLMPGRVH